MPVLYKRILIPTDGSAASSAAARAGVAFAKECHAETVGIHVAPEYRFPLYAQTIPPEIPPDYPTQDEYEASARKAGETYLSEIRDAAIAAGLAFTGIVVFSDSPAEQIVDAAEKYGCDLIFMGSHGRGGLGQLLLGSVTSKVLSACRTPVLVYRLQRSAARRGAAG